MSDGFALGLLGVPTGSAMNSVGLMYHSALTSDDPSIVSIPVAPCKRGEVRWASNGDCFVPNQTHVNMLVFSVIFNVILLIVVCLLVPWRKSK